MANLNKNYQVTKNNPLGPRTILLDFPYVNNENNPLKVNTLVSNNPGKIRFKKPLKLISNNPEKISK